MRDCIECLIPVRVPKLIIDPLKIIESNHDCRTALIVVEQLLCVLAELVQCPQPCHRINLISDAQVCDKSGKKVHIALLVIGHISLAVDPHIVSLRIQHTVFHIMIGTDMICHVLKIFQVSPLIIGMDSFEPLYIRRIEDLTPQAKIFHCPLGPPCCIIFHITCKEKGSVRRLCQHIKQF